MDSGADGRSSSGWGLDAPPYQLKRGWSGESAISLRVAIGYNRIRRDARSEYSASQSALSSGEEMTWEWEHRSSGGQWTLTIGGWRAVVQRLAGPRLLWQATLERTTAPHDRHQSPPYPDAMDARTWCLRTIAELAGPGS